MKRKMLIIDDDPNDIELIKEMLSNYEIDYEISSALSGEQGLTLAKELKPDIVMVDTIMPGMDGMEVCRQFKADESLSSQIVLMTGSIDAFKESKSEDAPFDDHCVKLGESILEALLRVHQKLNTSDPAA